jgi:hypothetical protein
VKIPPRAAVGESMNLRDRVLLAATAAIALVGAAACSGADRPPAASDAIGDAGSAMTSSFETPPSAPRARVCEPLSSRPCKLELGPTACPWTVQFCRPDGYDWYPCGQYNIDASAWDNDAGTEESDAGSDEPVENVPPTVDLH